MKLIKKIATLSIAVVLVGSTVLVSGCKKDKKTEDPTPTPTPIVLTNTQKLTGKNFKMTAFTVNPAYPIIGSDIYAQLPACVKDNLITFNSNNTLTDDEGASKCDPNDAQTIAGTWVWNPGETILTITEPDSDPISLTIITNDGTTLKGSYSEVDNGVTYTYTITWTKQ